MGEAGAAAVAAAAAEIRRGSTLYGVGYHSAWLSDLKECPPEVSCVELIADDFLSPPAARWAEVETLAARYPLLPHLIHPAPGNAVPPDPVTIRWMARLIDRVKAPWVSFHLAFTGVPGRPLGHLATLPFTREAMEIAAGNLRAWRSELGVPVLVENVTCGVTLPGEMDEAAFISGVLEAADAGLLLDLHNVYTNCVNAREDPVRFLQQLPLERVRQIHLGGGHEEDGVRVDSHTSRCPPGVWELLAWIAARTPLPAVTLEWDTQLPGFDVIREELATAAAVVERAVHAPA